HQRPRPRPPRLPRPPHRRSPRPRRPRLSSVRSNAPRNLSARRSLPAPPRRGPGPEPQRRDERVSTTTYRPERAPTPSYGRRVESDRPNQTPREGGRPAAERAPERSQRPGETVRSSALAPKPPPSRDGAAARGPRAPGSGLGRPELPPATPELQRATRQAPRPGGALLDRR